MRILLVGTGRAATKLGRFLQSDPRIDITIFNLTAAATKLQRARLFARVAGEIVSRRPPKLIIWDSGGLYAALLSALAGLRGTINAYRLRGDPYQEALERIEASSSRLTRLRLRIGLWTALLAIKRCDLVLTLTEALWQSFSHSVHLSTKKAVVLPNGIDTEQFRPADASESAALRAQLGWHADGPILLSMTNFNYWGKIQPMHAFAKAFAQLIERYPGLRWYIAGDGTYRQRFSEELGRIIDHKTAIEFLGWISDPAPYFRACTLFVHFTGLEGYGNVILEANACGKIVIANQHPIMVEVLDPACTGVVVDEDATEQIVQTVTELLDNVERRSGLEQCAVEHVRHSFSAEVLGSTLIHALSSHQR